MKVLSLIYACVYMYIYTHVYTLLFVKVGVSPPGNACYLPLTLFEDKVHSLGREQCSHPDQQALLYFL